MLATADFFFSFVVEDGRIYSMFPDFLIFTPMPKGVCLAEYIKATHTQKHVEYPCIQILVKLANNFPTMTA